MTVASEDKFIAEVKTFLGPGLKHVDKRGTNLCNAWRWCKTAGVVGVFLFLLSTVVFIAGPKLVQEKIQEGMTLKQGSEMLGFWLSPPVPAHLTGYAFHVTNPEEVQRGGKPVLVEVGPFVYRSSIIKDSKSKEAGKKNLEHNADGETLTYRPRNVYELDLSASAGDPATTFITVPNIALLTAFNQIRALGWGKGVATRFIENTGLGTPFINVSFAGLMWGYHDELPCIKMARPDECSAPEGEKDLFADDEDDEWKRKKRDVEFVEKAQAEIVDCKCTIGLHRDWDGTLKEPAKIHTGFGDMSKRGWVEEFNSSPTMGWWKPGSTCDQHGGHDVGVLPTGVETNLDLEVWISLVCRRITLKFEKNVTHLGLPAYRFAPPLSALGSHTDPDLAAQNTNNSCFCRDDEGFSCLKSGVFNMEPCKITPDTPRGSPIALSWPHFYQADPSYLAAVSGLKPEKDKHQFYMDVSPELGIPLAIRPRIQFNAIIRKDEDIESMRNFADELILPLIWVQDGFSEPSVEMVDLVRFCLSAAHQLPLLGGTVLALLGLFMVLVAGWGWWRALDRQVKIMFN